MKKLIFAALLVLAISTTAFACGAPQVIRGQVTAYGVPVYRAAVRISTDNQILETVLTSPFGYYELSPVLPCSTYEVRVTSKMFVFTPRTIVPANFPEDHSGIALDFIGQF